MWTSQQVMQAAFLRKYHHLISPFMFTGLQIAEKNTMLQHEQWEINEQRMKLEAQKNG